MQLTNVRPTSPPLVTFAQMQAQLRIVTTDEQQFVTDLVDACSAYAEEALDSSLLTRTITAVYNRPYVFHPGGGPGIDGWPANWRDGNRFFLPRGPVLPGAVASVIDANSKSLTFTQASEGLADYCVLGPGQSFVGPLTISYGAGYGAEASNVPSDLLMAIRTHAATLFEHRESVSEGRTLVAVPHSLAAFYALRRRATPVA